MCIPGANANPMGGGTQRLAAPRMFDPEGPDYDYSTAEKYGMGPDGVGKNAGHWGSVAPVSDDVRQKYNLPNGSYVILKGKSHISFGEAVKAEERRGSRIKKYGNRYYSIPIRNQ